MRKNKLVKLLFVLSVTVVFAAVFVLCNNYCITTTYSTYNTNKIQNNVRIIFVSDLHGKRFGKENKRLCRKILMRNPDIVVFAGDMAGSDDIEAAAKLAEGVSKGCRNVYFSFGNHESRFEYEQELIQRMEAAGAVTLNNESVFYKKGKTTVKITGIALPLYFYSGYDGSGELIQKLDVQTLNEYLGECDKSVFNVLIAHNPCYFESYAQWGADMVLSGHNHGGVIRLPYVGALFSPNGDSKNKHYDCGEYKINESIMYLSRGLGEWAGPVRMFNLPEVYVIDIKSDK